jgi:small subunit ribosomal protein S1
MDQTNAQAGQEEAPQGQINTKSTEEKPAASTASMEKLLQEEGLNLDFPKQGEIRTGVIASIGENEILVSVGTKSEGVISGKEREQIPAEVLESFQVGQEIPVYVLNPEDPSGTLVLSYNRAREETDWLEAEKLKDSGEAFDSKVIGYNKGGLIVPLGMLRGFVPASQVSVMRRVEGEDSPDARWGKMVGEEIKVAVIEVDRTRHRLILSERLALQETRETIKDRLLDELQEGTVKNGRVTSLADFGAFVNIDGADGLVHLSEISWDRIEHPAEVLKVGQEVKVKVIAVDQERKRIGLSIRQLQPDPWVVKVSNLKEGQLVEGTITHLTKFGAFARLDEDLEGLIHISELSDQRINHPKEVVKEGDVVTLRVIKIDSERRRIGLSLRKVDSMAYANLDYEMMLSGEAKAGVSQEETPSAEQETQESKEPPVTEAPADEGDLTSAGEVAEVTASAVEEAPAETAEAPTTPEAEASETEASETEAPPTPEVEASEMEAPPAPEAEASEMEAPTAPEAETSEMEASETEASVTPEAEAAETEAPTAPEAEASEMEAPTAPEAETSEMEASETEASVTPEAEATESEVPTTPEADSPEAEAPAMPEAEASETEAPTAPEVEKSEMEASETEASVTPEAEATESEVPTTPEADSPEAEAPAMPEAEASETEAPTTPEPDSPEAEAPAAPEAEASDQTEEEAEAD